MKPSSYTSTMEIRRNEITYGLIRRKNRIYLYLNTGRRSVAIASVSLKYLDDVTSFAIKLARKADENQIILDEANGDKVLIFMRVRPIISYDRVEKLKKIVVGLEPVELWFWAWKMREDYRRAPVAFVKLYGVR